MNDAAAPHEPPTLANLGRWFATAADDAGADAAPSDAVGATAGPIDPAPPGAVAASAPRASRGLPRMPAWGPDPRGGYGQVSDEATVLAALSVLRDAGRGAQPADRNAAPGVQPADGGAEERPARRGVTVITGAGVSTGSGLPDYRGANAVARAPMTVQEFTGSDLSRRRYWARSTVGWTQFLRARPGLAHTRLAALTAPLGIRAVITQNVDSLHQCAGSPHVIDLHGRLDTIVCLACRARFDRQAHHARLLAMNPQVAEQIDALAADAAQAPDGDAEVDRTHDFRYPPCPLCGGMLKPDVVFFGEGAARADVEAGFAAVDESAAVLVLGSSLTVMSGLRFVRRAEKLGRPVVVVNDGPTRADDLAEVRVHGRVEAVLGRWLAALEA